MMCNASALTPGLRFEAERRRAAGKLRVVIHHSAHASKPQGFRTGFVLQREDQGQAVDFALVIGSEGGIDVADALLEGLRESMKGKA